jgi:predicted nucleotidyltransferase
MISKNSQGALFTEARDRLVKTYNPIAIYVFGSYAWGHPDKDSDLDLLVIVDADIKDRYHALVEGHRALGDLSVPKDLLLLTRDEFEEASQRVTSLHYKIKHKGKQIYARA